MGGEMTGIGEQAIKSVEHATTLVADTAKRIGCQTAEQLQYGAKIATDQLSDKFRATSVSKKGTVCAVDASVRLDPEHAPATGLKGLGKAAEDTEMQAARSIHRDGRLTATDGQSIDYRITEPAGRPRAIVVLMQGTYGQPGYFDGMGEKLAKSGIKSYSVGSRVASPQTYTQHAQDLEDAVALARRENPGVPLTVMGVSLGAMITLDWSARFNTTGTPVVAMSPVVMNHFLGIKDSLTVGAGLLSKWAADVQVNTPFSVGAKLTTNPHAPKIADPQDMTVPAGLFDDVAKMSAAIAAKGRKMKGPLYMPLAGNDEVAVNWVTKLYANLIRSSDKTIETFPGTAHDLSLESNHPQLVKSLSDWILKH